jgi:hypothetical protein
MQDYELLRQRKKLIESHEARKSLLGRMTPIQAQQLLNSLVSISDTKQALDMPYIAETPTIKQQQFLECSVFEALFGGSAGGGKSSCLLSGAIRMAVNGGSALIIRRTFADLSLPGAIMDRSHEWLSNTDAKWHAQDKRWDFPSGGVLQFGYLENERDKWRYQGAEFQGLYVDELTQLQESQFLYLISRVRRKLNSQIRLEVRCASNPGGQGHDWVKLRYITKPEGRVFIPATLDDNPHIDQEAYREALMLLDETTRNQLLYGHWVRDDGGQLYRFTLQDNVVESFKVDDGTRYILGIDLGASRKSATTAFVVVSYNDFNPHTLHIVESRALSTATPTECAQVIEQLHDEYDFVSIMCDAGALGAGYVEEFRQRYALPVEPAQKRDKLAMRKLLNGEFERGTLMVVGEKNSELISELLNLQWDEKGLDAQPGQPDHLTDAMLYAYREAKHYAAQERDLPPDDFEGRAQWIEKRMLANAVKRSSHSKKMGILNGSGWNI